MELLKFSPRSYDTVSKMLKESLNKFDVEATDIWHGYYSYYLDGDYEFEDTENSLTILVDGSGEAIALVIAFEEILADLWNYWEKELAA